MQNHKYNTIDSTNTCKIKIQNTWQIAKKCKIGSFYWLLQTLWTDTNQVKNIYTTRFRSYGSSKGGFRALWIFHDFLAVYSSHHKPQTWYINHNRLIMRDDELDLARNSNSDQMTPPTKPPLPSLFTPFRITQFHKQLLRINSKVEGKLCQIPNQNRRRKQSRKGERP